MKKIIIAVVIIAGNYSLFSCTRDSLSDTEDEITNRIMAEDTTGTIIIDPPDDPPKN